MCVCAEMKCNLDMEGTGETFYEKDLISIKMNKCLFDMSARIDAVTR